MQATSVVVDVPASPLPGVVTAACVGARCPDPDRPGRRVLGMCSRCYEAELSTGRRRVTRIRGPLAVRLYKRVSVDVGGELPPHAPTLGVCHPWTGAVDSEGYGSVWVGEAGRDTDRVHRVVWELEIGPIPAGLQPDHLCHHADHCPGGRCRHRLCANVDHMRLVTAAENNAAGRSNSPAARNAAKTHCARLGHELAGANLIVRRDGRRECGTCRTLRAYGVMPGAGQLDLFQTLAGDLD